MSGCTVKILETKDIRHRASEQGVVIGKIQTVQVLNEDGVEVRREQNRFWYRWETGKLDHVDTVPA